MTALASTLSSSAIDPLQQARVDLACAFRWAARLNWHEAVANHFSLAVNESGSRFLINPGFRHFSLIRASELLLVDADDPPPLEGDNAPDPTAWGLHGSIHRRCPHARCVLHVHSRYATVLASLADSTLPPIDQNSARFYNRMVVDEGYGGMAFEEEGERCAQLLDDPSRRVMVMGNHGVLAIGPTVAQAFDQLYYFERAAETVVTAYMTGRALRVLSPEVAEHTARQWEEYPGPSAERHFADLHRILQQEEPEYRL